MLPDFIIIGTQKGGTTSLHFYLGQHPEIAVSWPKELNFFIEEHNWHRGRAWYGSHFNRKARVRGEASPNYTAYPCFTGAAERMHEVVPQAKLIYVLRDPIERLISNYVHVVSEGREQRPAAQVLLQAEPNGYMSRSRYASQLEQYLRYYPMERILILSSEELYANRQVALRNTFRFLGVNADYDSIRFRATHNRSKNMRSRTPLGRRLFLLAKRLPLHLAGHDLGSHIGYALSFPFSRAIPRPTLAPEVRADLADRLADDLARLRSLTGRRFSEWSC